MSTHVRSLASQGQTPAWVRSQLLFPSVPQFPHLEVVIRCWWSRREAWHILGAQWTFCSLVDISVKVLSHSRCPKREVFME